jgi:hypothetical protein
MRGNISDSQFDMLSSNSDNPSVNIGKSDFFSSFGISEFTMQGKKITTEALDPETKSDY